MAIILVVGFLFVLFFFRAILIFSRLSIPIYNYIIISDYVVKIWELI